MGCLSLNTRLEKDEILQGLLKILEDMTSDWDRGFSAAISLVTRLGADLAFESIQLVRLVVAIQKHFRRQDLPFQDLFLPEDGEIDDLRVSDLVDFLSLHLNRPEGLGVQRG